LLKTADRNGDGKMLSTSLIAAALVAVGATTAAAEKVSARDDLADCQGYKATSVNLLSAGLTAKLSLKGDGCGVYGEDLADLVLEVTYETGA
jgi:alpha-glucosidase